MERFIIKSSIKGAGNLLMFSSLMTVVVENGGKLPSMSPISMHISGKMWPDHRCQLVIPVVNFNLPPMWLTLVLRLELWISLQNFACLKWRYWDNQRPGGRWIMEKLWNKKSRDTVPLNTTKVMHSKEPVDNRISEMKQCDASWFLAIFYYHVVVSLKPNFLAKKEFYIFWFFF